MSCRSSKFSNQLQATLSKCPGFNSQSVRLFLRLSRDRFAFGLVRIHGRNLVGALGLDVAGLLALVASSLGRGLRGAVAGEMADFATVVAFLTLGTVTRHVSVSTARVAGLSTTSSTAEATTVSTLLATESSSTISTGLGAVTSDVTNL